MSDPKHPPWLANKRVRKQKKTTDPKSILNSKKVGEVLKEAGLTIIVDDIDPSKIVAATTDPDDVDEIKAWNESRAMSVSGKAVRDRFVIEFMKDFHGPDAAVRCGSANPLAFWRRMRVCGYTQRLISHKMAEWESAAILTKDRVCAVLWRESNDFTNGTAATRVGAVTKLAKILGYEVDTLTVNLNGSAEFIETPLTKGEFLEMRDAFEDDF